MNITFDWAGVTLKADVTIEDDDIEFDTLTCFGEEAGFLLDTIHRQDIYDAALTAATAPWSKAVQALQEERAADIYQLENSC